MKKFTFLLASVVASIGVSAQTFVDTTVQNKSVVLEEYTGVRCGFCPDGHKRANDFAKQNPGRVVLVNIHTGSYAAPRQGYPDYTTTGGDQIAGHSNVQISGYPAGSVQRRIFANPQRSGTASSRGVWARDGGIVLGETSPVNAAVKATYDNVKKEVSVVVEAYFTDNAPGTANRITVGITQDGLKSAQSGAAANPDNIDSDGLYIHNHMLRDFITPAFGDLIGANTKGTFFTKTYTWSVPNDIKGHAVAVQNLSAFVIIAEDQQKILTGAEAKVELPASLRTDLNVASKVSEPTGMCNGDLTPSFEVENKDVNDITSFKMSYTLNGGTPVVETYTGTLKQGQKATVTFPKITLAPGTYNTISYSRPYDISGGLIDVNGGSIEGGTYAVVKQKAFNADIKEDFTNVSDLNSFPANWIQYAEGALDGRVYVASTVGTAGTSSRGQGFWVSLSWGDVGDKAGFIIGELDKTGMDTAIVNFSTAYAQLRGGEPDKVSLLVSEDCGDTWTSAWSKSGADLKPYGTNSSSILVPTVAGNWSDWEADISSYGDAVLLKLEVETGKGNSLWLDDIGIRMAKTDFTSVAENAINSKVSVYPNPAKSVATVSLNGADWNNAVVSLIDVTGKVVSAQVASGSNDIILNLSQVEAGVYNVQVSEESSVSVTRLVVK